MLGDIAVGFSEGSRARPGAIHRSVAKMRVERPAPAPIQLDGERMDAEAAIEFTVDPGALRILVPAESTSTPQLTSPPCHTP
jgi:diacylglycerol kinase family enzyme